MAQADEKFFNVKFDVEEFAEKLKERILSELRENLDDTISRRAAVDEIDKLPTFLDPYGETMISKSAAKIRILSLPAGAQKTGRWIFNTKFFWECSECGNNPTRGMGYVQGRDELYPFCPYCNADMRGKNK